MTKDITLVFPECDFLIDPMVFPPLGILYVAFLLERLGHNVRCVDLNDKDNKLEDRFYKRNKVLMDFRCIPQAVRSNIIKAYENYEYPDADNIYKFFSKNKFRGFLDEFTSVENRLLRLY